MHCENLEESFSKATGDICVITYHIFHAKYFWNWFLLFDHTADLKLNRVLIPPKVLKSEATAHFSSEQ